MKILTKGDNNSVDDRGLYAPGQLWLEKKDIVGRTRGFVPYVGIITILMNDYPKFKVIASFSGFVYILLIVSPPKQYAVLGVLALFVLVHRE